MRNHCFPETFSSVGKRERAKNLFLGRDILSMEPSTLPPLTLLPLTYQSAPLGFGISFGKYNLGEIILYHL